MAQRVTPKKINLTNKLMIIIISILVLAVCSFIVFQLIEYFKLHKQKPIVKDSTNSGNDMLQASTKKMKSDSDGWEIISRYDDGSIQSKVRIVDGVTEKHLFFENGNLYYKAFLVNENLQGKQFEYHENGNILCVRSYIDDIQQGETIEYFESGEIQRKINFHKGKPNGKGFIYFKNGNVQSEGIFLDGVLDGKCVYYFESGILKNDYNFLAGKHDGEQLEYYENGNLREKGFFVDGKRHGKSYVLTEFGMVAKDQNYENGELVDEDDHITLLKLIINTKTQVQQDAEAIDEKNIDVILQWIDSLIFTKYKQFPELNDDYKNEIEIIYQDFIEEFKNFNSKDVDVDYYHKIVLARVWNNIVDLDFDPDKYEWQEYHHMRYQSDFNDLNDDEKLEYIEATKKAIIGFGFVYDTLRKRLLKIEKLNSKFGLEQNTEFKKVDFILAQSHASVYANCVMVYSFEHLQSFSNSDKTVFENLFHGFKNSENYIMRNAIIKLSTDLASDLISESDDQDKIEKIKQGTFKLAQEIVNRKTGNYSQE